MKLATLFVILAIPTLAEPEVSYPLSSRLEASIRAGDSLDKVLKELRANGLEPKIHDHSADFEEMKKAGALSPVERIVLRMSIYQVDAGNELGITFHFNHKKELCGYACNLELSQKDRGKTLHVLRQERERSFLKMEGQGAADSKENSSMKRNAD